MSVTGGSADYLDRFWIRVDEQGPDACWLWTGGAHERGYGHATGRGRMVRATHVAWSLSHGEDIPDGLNVLHVCDCPPCVNPAHLVIGDQAMNAQHAIERDRMFIPKGEQHGGAKLSRSEVAHIKLLHRRGWTGATLARRYGVSQSQISRIVRGIAWSHVGVEVVE